ncbi:hypothetical protein DL93DRAFT_2166530 [Clavulina sp. PMI_390]|nr:hypothetical protein DL93DRAFT_2166530 [Clavulina sp. PMI_390]
MHRRRSSVVSIQSEASSITSPRRTSFSSGDKYTCPVCNTMMFFFSPDVFDDHVEHCNLKRTVATTNALRRRASEASSLPPSDLGELFSSESSSSSSGEEDNHGTIRVRKTLTIDTIRATQSKTRQHLRATSLSTFTFQTPSTSLSSLAYEVPTSLDDARFTLSASGDATEFGGFGDAPPMPGYVEPDSAIGRTWIPDLIDRRPRPSGRVKLAPRSTLRRRVTGDLHYEARQ